MKLKVYSVLDKAVNAYMQPFYSRAKGEAIRSFSDACTDEKSNFTKYPDDYVLFELGEYDDSSGLFSCREPMRIISAREVLGDPFDADTEIKSAGKQRLPM